MFFKILIRKYIFYYYMMFVLMKFFKVKYDYGIYWNLLIFYGNLIKN